MKRKLCLLAIWIGIALGSAPASADPFVVALNHAPPYRIVETGDAGTRISGFYVDFIREAAKRLQFRLQFKVVPFRRALALMKNGSADIMVGPNRTAEREAYMVYLDEELSREAKAFFVRPDAPDIVAYEDLRAKRIGVLRGSTYFDRFDKDASLSKQTVGHYSNALKMVAGGRLDVVIAPELLGDFLVRQLGLELKKTAYRVPGRPSYIAVSRKSALASLQSRLEATIRDMKADGTVARIIAGYR